MLRGNFRRIPFLCALGLPLGCLFFAIGCESENSGKPTSRPGDSVLKDPYGYKPFADDPNISGGGISDFDKKSFKRDLDGFINP